MQQFKEEDACECVYSHKNRCDQSRLVETGIWVDGGIWGAYRELCGREGFRPAEPVERFLRFVLRDGSVLSVVNWLDKAGRIEGLEAYVRVLLSWHRSGKLWMYVSDEDEAPIEPLLLSVLKEVSDPVLRREIEEELSMEPGEEEEPSEKQVEAEEEIAEKLKKLKDLRKELKT